MHVIGVGKCLDRQFPVRIEPVYHQHRHERERHHRWSSAKLTSLLTIIRGKELTVDSASRRRRSPRLPSLLGLSLLGLFIHFVGKAQRAADHDDFSWHEAFETRR